MCGDSMRPSAPTLAVCILTRRGGSFFFFAHAREQSTTDKQVSPFEALIPYWRLSQASIRKQATARGGKNSGAFPRIDSPVRLAEIRLHAGNRQYSRWGGCGGPVWSDYVVECAQEDRQPTRIGRLSSFGREWILSPSMRQPLPVRQRPHTNPIRPLAPRLDDRRGTWNRSDLGEVG
jgi:hypothetical protein